MEVVVQSIQNVDPGSVISIRAGATRRQGPTPLEKPFHFPNLPLNVGSIKVDVLRPLGSCRVSVAPEAEEEYSILFPQGDNADPMKMDLLVREVPHGVGVLHPDQEGYEDPNRHLHAEDSAKSYMERWRLKEFIFEMLQYIIREKPQDPYAFMSSYLRRRTRKDRSAAPSAVPEQEEADLHQDSVRATIARQNLRLDAENERLRREIETLRQFCEEKGLPPIDEPLDLTITATALGIHEADLSGRNSKLRIEHQELRRTLDTFCRGFQDLASRLNAVVAAAPGLTTLARPPSDTQTPSYEDVTDAEIEVERENRRIANENAELSQQIEVLMASGALPQT